MSKPKRSPASLAPRAGAAPPPAAKVRLSLAKKAAFSVVAIVLAWVVSEGVLALLGVKPALPESDADAGFTSQSRLFVEEESGGGGKLLVTARNRLDFFNLQRFPKTKAPGVTRIFSLGGSTTYGHPYTDSTSFNGWLREFLRATAPGRGWEVINAGGISYGSDRVVRLMRELIHYQPDLFVVYCGQNEFLERHIYDKLVSGSRLMRGLTSLARGSRTAGLLQRLMAPLRPPGRAEAAASGERTAEPVTLLDNTFGPTAYTRDEEWRAQTFRRYQVNLGRMIDLAQSVQARVIFVVPASNLRDPSPFKSEHRKDLSEADRRRWLELYRRACEDFNHPSPTNALEALGEAATIDDLAADLHFVRGRVLEKLGRFAEAKAAYERARDEDVCPLRAPGAIRKLLMQVAAERQVPLIDFEALQEARSEHGIPGAAVFLDHVHPTIEGNRLLALEILKTMEKEGIAHPAWDPALIQQATQAVLSRIDTKAQSLALMRLCKTLGWAGRREEAYRAGARAAGLGPDIAEVRYEAGLAAQLSNHPDEALEHYRRAVALQPALADAHCAMGVILEDRGQLTEAIAHYRLALQFGNPKNADRDRKHLDEALQRLRQQPTQ